jgi:hypothetical protein
VPGHVQAKTRQADQQHPQQKQGVCFVGSQCK